DPTRDPDTPPSPLGRRYRERRRTRVLRVRTTLHLAIAAVLAAASVLAATRPASAAASTGFLDRTPGGTARFSRTSRAAIRPTPSPPSRMARSWLPARAAARHRRGGLHQGGGHGRRYGRRRCRGQAS